MTGRKVPAEECYRIGLCERVVANGTAREEAEALAAEIASFPQACVRADRASIYNQWDKTVWQAMYDEWEGGIGVIDLEGIAGATRFKHGAGRSGDFENI